MGVNDKTHIDAHSVILFSNVMLLYMLCLSTLYTCMTHLGHNNTIGHVYCYGHQSITMIMKFMTMIIFHGGKVYIQYYCNYIHTLYCYTHTSIIV